VDVVAKRKNIIIAPAESNSGRPARSLVNYTELPRLPLVWRVVAIILNIQSL